MDLLQVVADSAAVIIALAALVFSFRIEARNHRRFEQDLETSRKLAAANLKPLLYIRSQTYADLKSVILENRGVGPAVITRIRFSKDGRESRNLAELFGLPEVRRWDLYRTYAESGTHLRAGAEEVLVRLSQPRLVEQGFAPEEALEILRRWQQAKTGIRIEIDYQDVLGNPQPPLAEVLK